MTRIEYRCSVIEGHDEVHRLAVDRVLPPSKEPQGLTISFQRTIRVPDNGTVNKLPPGRGCFPLYKVQDYASRLPQDMVDKGGIFFHMHQKEAMWICFHATAPFLLKIYIGGVNAISGEHSQEDATTRSRRLQRQQNGDNIQDYVVLPEQPWLDGMAIKPGCVRQFVAMPMGQGYSVEAQLTGKEAVGGLQFEVTPAKAKLVNRWAAQSPRYPNPLGNFHVLIKTLTGGQIHVRCSPSDDVISIKWATGKKLGGMAARTIRLVYAGMEMQDGESLERYGIKSGDVLFVVFNLRGGGTVEGARNLSIAADGIIEQNIQKDRHDTRKWIKELTFTIPVQIFNTAQFRRVTGTEPPPYPLTAETYVEAGLPFFDLFEEEPSTVSGAGAFDSLKSINEIEQLQGLVIGEERGIHPRTVQLFNTGTEVSDLEN